MNALFTINDILFMYELVSDHVFSGFIFNTENSSLSIEDQKLVWADFL
jgi:hypothetical protein